MYKFKKINKTKMYQLVKEFAGIHWGDDVYLLVSQEETYLPDFDVVHPERKDEVVHLNAHWLYDHGFLDKDSIREEAV